ncbi:MAG: tRNA(Ile)-lysidine synthase [Actinobacteria bacterium]|nr:tRNA(Ile)-lysidine synthase [Actinomycetota bacterium]
MQPLELKEKVKENIRRNKLIDPGALVIVSVSGGPDSLCLLHLLSQLREELHFAIHVFHLDHLTRDGESTQDARYVKSVAENWNLPVTMIEADIEEISKRERRSFQSVAREIRRNHLLQLADSLGASRIATGHQADDQVETFLFRLLRGSGPKGLGGMNYREGKLIKPLLNVWRREIEDYCQAAGLSPRMDWTNREMKYERNRIRNQLIPYLEREFSPALRDIVFRTAEILRDEEEVMDSLAEELFQNLAVVREESVQFYVKELARQPRALVRRILRRSIQRVKGELLDVDFLPLEEVAQALEADESFHILMEGGLEVYREYDRIVATKRSVSGESDLRERELPLEGELDIPEAGLVLKTREMDYNRESPIPQGNTVWMDLDKIVPPLKVRGWRGGDRFIPLGMKKIKKLQDFFVDSKVPRRARKRVPIVEDFHKIVWVAGLRMDQRVRIDGDTKRVLEIELRRVG